MEKRVASILLMLSVQALLVVAGLCAAAGSGDTDIIRLPSESEGNNERPPWRCCNDAQCTKSWPPICRCMDKVERCSDACKKCVDVEGSSKACADWYRGQLPPRCDHDQDNNVVHGDVVTGARKEEDEETPPWKCCNNALCTRSWPPVCRCMDKVEHCSDACKKCVDVEGSSKACEDWYRGQLPPRCDDDQDKNVVHFVVPGASKESDGERPWKCCNRPVIGPTTSETPVWYCLDKFQHCDCEHCSKVHSGHGYHCLDGYKGSNPGPSCTHDG